MIHRTCASLLVLTMIPAACAPRYRSVAVPTGRLESRTAQTHPVSASDAWQRLARQLPPAAIVRLLLVDGTRLRGVVVSADVDALVVKPKTRLPEPPRRIAYSAIESMEVDTGRGIGVGKAIAIGAGSGAAAFLTMLFVALTLIAD